MWKDGISPGAEGSEGSRGPSRLNHFPAQTPDQCAADCYRWQNMHACTHTHTHIVMLLHTHTHTHTRTHTRMHTPIHTLIDARIRMHTLMHTDMHACANPVPHTGTEGCGTIRPWPLAICPFPWFHPTPTFKKQHCSVPVVKGKEQQTVTWYLVDVDIWCYHVSALNAGSILLVLALFDVSAISAGNKYLVDVGIVWCFSRKCRQ